jgi:hypothetical protein
MTLLGDEKIKLGRFHLPAASTRENESRTWTKPLHADEQPCRI